jgi:hypothetical protein
MSARCGEAYHPIRHENTIPRDLLWARAWDIDLELPGNTLPAFPHHLQKLRRRRTKRNQITRGLGSEQQRGERKQSLRLFHL